MLLMAGGIVIGGIMFRNKQPAPDPPMVVQSPLASVMSMSRPPSIVSLGMMPRGSFGEEGDLPRNNRYDAGVPGQYTERGAGAFMPAAHGTVGVATDYQAMDEAANSNGDPNSPTGSTGHGYEAYDPTEGPIAPHRSLKGVYGPTIGTFLEPVYAEVPSLPASPTTSNNDYGEIATTWGMEEGRVVPLYGDLSPTDRNTTDESAL
jgi:hypothetical protein